MNKHLIALAVTAATLSGAASAAQVYSDDTSSLAIGGRIEATGLYKQQADNLADNQKTSGEVTDMSRARINLDAKTQIADGVQGIGFFEKEFHSNTNALTGRGADETRYVYAGVNSDQYGQIVYGKADGSLGMLTDFTDIMAYAGSEVGGTKLAVADRTNNNLAYTGNFGDLTFKANYVFAGADYDSAGNKTDVHGFSTGAIYKVADTGLALGAGYGEQRDQNGVNTHKARSEQTFATASYTMGDLYFGGLYKSGRRDGKNLVTDQVTDTQGYEFAAAYTMGKTVFTTTYGFMKDENAHNVYDELANAAAVDATYYFNSNFRTYASYKFNMLDKNKVGKVAASDEFVLGARYDF
ncbi:porin [Photobacterium angustum]|uniref:Porin n=1 Tax=Photobacterium angustum TaxID=661 RepID=A0A855S9T4_PHOAN|nr:porin [Photobacterium angustum]KJF81475.1 membrane protein [Photobacterium damselae subsp. damselae]KJG01622.1 membrane protein [Photobacterium angustum]KJG30328.1 membrane protein [Photobacterium angustum]KJG41024.1 membrane protein [Photobacterium angustum]KJG45060.1 membrane protein [Photobacterium angustum]